MCGRSKSIAGEQSILDVFSATAELDQYSP